jgi:fatty-acyl-CoA synthase
MAVRRIADMLRERASAQRDRLAIGLQENGDWVMWTWGEFWSIACGAAAGLAMAGIRPGHRVMLVVPEVRPAVTALFGIWALGAVPIPVGVPFALNDPAAFLDRLAAMARRLGAETLLLSSTFAQYPAASGGGVRRIIVDDVLAAAAAGHVPEARRSSEDASPLAYIQLTSGSTGRPRAIAVPHDRLSRHLAAMSAALPSRHDSVGVSWLPLHHDMGLVGGLLFPIHNGFPIHMIATNDFRSRPWSWLEAMARFRGTICAAPPSAYALCTQLALRAVRAGLNLSAWECALVGAEPISAGLLRRFAAAFAPCGFRPEAFLPVYGLAEATLAVTFPPPLASTRIDRVDRAWVEQRKVAVPGDGQDALEFVGVGRPIPGTQLLISDQNGQALPDRRIGEVLVRSATLLDAYVGEPRHNSPICKGWLRTGDLGYIADGDLFITGRTKDLIIQGGHNLYPSILEDIVAGIEGVRAGAAAAIGVHSAERDTEKVCIVAETRLPKSEQPLLAARIRQAMSSHGIVLDRVLLIPPRTLPRTTSGKLRRQCLARAIANGASGDVIELDESE